MHSARCSYRVDEGRRACRPVIGKRLICFQSLSPYFLSTAHAFFSERGGAIGTLALGMPGHVFQHIALVNLDGVIDLRSARLMERAEGLNNSFCPLHFGGDNQLTKDTLRQIVIRLIA